MALYFLPPSAQPSEPANLSSGSRPRPRDGFILDCNLGRSPVQMFTRRGPGALQERGCSSRDPTGRTHRPIYGDISSSSPFGCESCEKAAKAKAPLLFWNCTKILKIATLSYQRKSIANATLKPHRLPRSQIYRSARENRIVFTYRGSLAPRHFVALSVIPPLANSARPARPLQASSRPVRRRDLVRNQRAVG